MGISPIGIWNYISPPRVDGENADLWRWRQRVSFILWGITMTLAAFIVALFVGLLTPHIPGLAMAGELRELKGSIETQRTQLQAQIANNSLTGLESQLDGWRRDQCVAESMGNRGLVVAIAARIREKQRTYRQLSGGVEYQPLPCP